MKYIFKNSRLYGRGSPSTQPTFPRKHLLGADEPDRRTRFPQRSRKTSTRRRDRCAVCVPPSASFPSSLSTSWRVSSVVTAVATAVATVVSTALLLSPLHHCPDTTLAGSMVRPRLSRKLPTETRRRGQSFFTSILEVLGIPKKYLSCQNGAPVHQGPRVVLHRSQVHPLQPNPRRFPQRGHQRLFTTPQ